MIWSSWLQATAPALGLSPSQWAVLLSLIISGFMGLLGMLAANGRRPEVSGGLPSMFGLVFFIFAQWLPIWVGTALGLLTATMISYAISKHIGSE